MMKYYKEGERYTPEIEMVSKQLQLFFIQKKRLPQINEMKESYLKYEVEIKNKKTDFLIFQFFDTRTFFKFKTKAIYPYKVDDTIVHAANHLMRQNFNENACKVIFKN
jgi:hypothetical protein